MSNVNAANKQSINHSTNEMLGIMVLLFQLTNRIGGFILMDTEVRIRWVMFHTRARSAVSFLFAQFREKLKSSCMLRQHSTRPCYTKFYKKLKVKGMYAENCIVTLIPLISRKQRRK